MTLKGCYDLACSRNLIYYVLTTVNGYMTWPKIGNPVDNCYMSQKGISGTWAWSDENNSATCVETGEMVKFYRECPEWSL